MDQQTTQCHIPEDCNLHSHEVPTAVKSKGSAPCSQKPVIIPHLQLALTVHLLTTAFVRIYLNMPVSWVPPDVVCLTFLASAHLCRGTESSEVWAPITKTVTLVIGWQGTYSLIWVENHREDLILLTFPKFYVWADKPAHRHHWASDSEPPEGRPAGPLVYFNVILLYTYD
jgi:hypothetical protein